MRFRHVPGRLTTGVFLINSGLSKRHADEGTAAALHGMATGAYPFLRSIPPQRASARTSRASPSPRTSGCSASVSPCSSMGSATTSV